MIKEYHIQENGEQLGPFLLHELESRGVALDTQVLSPLSDGWHAAADLAEFTEYFYSKGIYIVTEENLAGFWWRLLAYVIDYFILILVIGLLAITYDTIAVLAGRPVFSPSGNDVEYNIISILFFIIYNSICEATPMRGSLGKVICRLAVVNMEGERESFGKALSRNLGKLLSSMILGIGYLAVFWSTYKQAWHDELAKTYVIRKPVMAR